MANYIVGLEPGDKIRFIKDGGCDCFQVGMEYEISDNVHNDKSGYGFECNCGGYTYPANECKIECCEVVKKRGPW